MAGLERDNGGRMSLASLIDGLIAGPMSPEKMRVHLYESIRLADQEAGRLATPEQIAAKAGLPLSRLNDFLALTASWSLREWRKTAEEVPAEQKRAFIGVFWDRLSKFERCLLGVTLDQDFKLNIDEVASVFDLSRKDTLAELAKLFMRLNQTIRAELAKLRASSC